MKKRIYLSPPHMSGLEQQYIQTVFDSNWIAPLGPQVNAFETEFAAAVDADHALALSSGTAALHLSLILAGVEQGGAVIVFVERQRQTALGAVIVEIETGRTGQGQAGGQ